MLKGYLYPLAIKTVERLVTEKTGGNIDIGAVEIGFFPASIDLKDVFFSYDHGGEVRFKVKEIVATMNMVQAFSGTITINHLNILEPQLSLSANNKFLKSLVRTKPESRVKKPSFFRMDVRSIAIERGSVSAVITDQGGLELENISFNYSTSGVDEANLVMKVEKAGIAYNKIREELERLEIEGLLSREALTLRQVKGEVAGKFLSGNITIGLAVRGGVTGSLSGQLPLKRLAHYSGMRGKVSGTAGFSSRFSYDNEGLKLKADLGMSRGAVRGVDVKDLKADLAFEKGVLAVDQISVRFFEGMAVAKGRVDLNSGGYGLSAHFRDLELPDSSWERKGALPGGRADGRLKGNGNFKVSSFEGDFTTEISVPVGSGKGQVEKLLTVAGGVAMVGKEINIEKGIIRGKDIEGEVAGNILLGGNVVVEVKLNADDLSLFSAISGADLAGSADLSGRVYGSLKQPSLDLRLNLKDARYATYNAKAVRGLVRWVSPRLILSDIEILGEESRLEVSGQVAFSSGKPDADITVDASRGELAELLSMAGKELPLKGALKGRVQIMGGSSAPLVLSAGLDLRRANLYGETFDRITVNGTYAKGRFNFERLDARKGRAHLRGEGGLSLKGPLRMAVSLENVDLRRIKVLRERLQGVEGIINFKGRLEGTSRIPQLRGELTADRVGWEGSDVSASMACALEANVNARNPKGSSLKLNVRRLDADVLGNSYSTDTPFLLDYDDESASLKGFVAHGPQGALSVLGRLDKGGALHFDLDGKVEVGGIERKLKAVEMIKGTVNLKASVSGSLKKPEINAALMTEGGSVRFIGFPYDMTSIKGKVSMTPDLLTIEGLSGELQGTALTGGGEVSFEKLRPKALNLFFDVGEVDLIYPEWLPSRSKGRITVTGPRDKITLGGDIEVIRASYTENVEITKMIAKAIEAGKKRGGGGERGGGAQYQYAFQGR